MAKLEGDMEENSSAAKKSDANNVPKPANWRKQRREGLVQRMKSLHWNAFRSTDRGVLDEICHDRPTHSSFVTSSYGGSMDLSSFSTSYEVNLSFDRHSTHRSSVNVDQMRGANGAASTFGWPFGKINKVQPGPLYTPRNLRGGKNGVMYEEKREKWETQISEIEMMKERYARLLLGEDMSGGGKGVCTALAISNAITNLSASVFGELYRLEPLAPDRKNMWEREMKWLLSVTDHIVEFVPTWQSFPDGSSKEVMVSIPRSDLQINIPALRKLDTMLQESLDSFTKTEFWYTEHSFTLSNKSDHNFSRDSFPRQEEKWWLPVIKIPTKGLSDESRKHLQQQRECLNQVLKAAMAINAQLLSEMEVPDAYWDAISKNGKASLGEALFRKLTSEQFSPDSILLSLELSTERSAVEVADRIEAAIQAWNRKVHSKATNPAPRDGRFKQRPSWGIMKGLVAEMEKIETLVERAETLLLCLRQKFPGLQQTLLEMNKIQHNKDVGQAILESYSRVLESLAYNIIARLDDVIYADDMTKNPPSPTEQAPAGKSSSPVQDSLFSTRDFIESSTNSQDGFRSRPKSAFLHPAKQTYTKVASSFGKTLAHLLEKEAQNEEEDQVEGAKDRGYQTVPTIEGKTKMCRSYAQNLEIAKAAHSPPSRD
ncbi:hypothetical protein O6H91_14G005900 [Diphasiastrum complanatum]|uniref:Uncharacterized protein n=3 Tax=Diphasiastrum complanatum TaxID=34168 RepID=A0ACC2BLW0_DIPCM|nr:hypothetical protein O6H91_14G005900 [Diphasiastrum complanatum]KAJ7530495.1 hypothetical protein O6H91_14G005900 [Diphasiastrum complanatum]KAJ7530499.1 hypothetical protein O6H91_14G005900 [Diphasiastrum complanatum]